MITICLNSNCLETINDLKEQLISANAEIKRLKSASMECPSCQADLSYEPTAREESLVAEVAVLQKELDETIKSHQKQNAVVAKFEAIFCDYHLDNLPVGCPCCTDVEHHHEVGGEA